MQMLRWVSLDVDIVAAVVDLSAMTVNKTIGWIRRCCIVQPPKTFLIPQRGITISSMLPVGVSMVAAIAVRLVLITRISTSIIGVLLFQPTSVAVRWVLSMATGRMLTVVPHIIEVVHIAWLRPISKWMSLSFIISIIVVNWFEGFQLIGRKWLLISKRH